MILIDFNQLAISNLMMEINNKSVKEPSVDLVRHMVYNSIRMYNQKFGSKFGEIVIGCDNGNYWRREVFPQYKAHRKAAQEKTGIDWNLIFLCLNEVRNDIKQFLPFKVIDVFGAEADDVIAVLTKNAPQDTPVLIISGDHDFLQLHTNPNIKQYAPVQKKFKTTDDPKKSLKEHIISGDSGDGIPNFMSPDNTFTDKIRQKPVTAKKLALWMEQDPSEFCTNDQTKYQWARNERLIDFNKIPQSIQDAILEQYKLEPKGSVNGLFNHLVSKRMVIMLDSVHEFKPHKISSLEEFF